MNDYTSAEFWKGAPDTSTHYQPPRGEGFNPVFWRVDNGVPVEAWAVMQNGSFTHVPKPSYIDDVFGRLIPRPAPQWSGEGPPPVGVVCERRTMIGGDGRYEQVRIIAHTSKGFPVWENTDAMFAGISKAQCMGDYPEFRPISTTEQIAADEREAAIDELTAGFSNDTLRSWAIHAYDELGYRKGDAK